MIHESCRLILGARSRIRAGALLRDEVVIGDDCLIGAHCELARSVVLGPHTDFGHHIVFGDSIAGAGVLLSGLTGVANTHIHHDEEIGIRTRSGKVMTGRKYLGALIGDGARLGTNTAICPGTVIAPNLELPPGAVLLGVVDAERRDALMRDFFTRWAP